MVKINIIGYFKCDTCGRDFDNYSYAMYHLGKEGHKKYIIMKRGLYAGKILVLSPPKKKL